MTTAYGLQCARFLAQYDVIVDNFATNKRWRPAVHLLTHMHKDHTQGLARKTPTATLRTLVASHTTLSWLQWRHPAWVAPPRLVVAAPDYKWVAPRDDLQVMAIPAWHCPGAVMFIVKVKNGPTVLVTGDYRVVGDEQLRAIAAAGPYDAVLQDGSRTNIRDWPLPPLSQTAATLETLIERALKSTSRKVYVRARWHGVELLLRDVGPVWVSDTFPDADWTRVWLRNQGVTVDRSARVVLTRQAPFVRPNTPDAVRPIVIVPSLRWHNCNNDVREEVVQKGHVYYVRLSAHADAAEAELVLRAAKARQVVTCQDHRGAEEACTVSFNKRRRWAK
jgi:glyoxylase-like metal-dependent hydrolase (beta-lactamase superfamily II)